MRPARSMRDRFQNGRRAAAFGLWLAALAIVPAGVVAATPRGTPDTRIAIAPGRVISPDQALAPSFVIDDNGWLLVVDQLWGFLLGRFRMPPGTDSAFPYAQGGVPLENGLLEEPSLPFTPLTTQVAQRGFPFLAEGPIAGSPCVADLDGNGRAEIVMATTTGIVYLLKSDGRISQGWPLQTGDSFYAAPSAGDIDGDHDREIVLGGLSGKLYAWHLDGSLVAGWPMTLDAEALGPGPISGSAAVADINADGADEVCVGATDGSVWILRGGGYVSAGWPKLLPPSSDPPNPAAIHAPPAVADLDGDGEPEIVVATNAGRIHAWHTNGMPVADWPVEVPHRARAGYVGPAIGDVNADGDLEIVVASEQGLLGPATVAVFNARGELLPGWPRDLPETVNAGIALGDLSGDGLAEIAVATIGGNPLVYVFDGRTAEPLPGWPLRLREETVNASPVIADLDGDATPDLLVASLSSGPETRTWLWAFSGDGHQLSGFPILLPYDEIVRASPAVADLDGDGDLELLAATERMGDLHAWDLQVLCEPALLPWPTQSGGPARTACLEIPAAVTGLGKLGRAGDEVDAQATPTSDDAGSPFSTITFELEHDTRVNLSIFDVQGTLVRKLLDHRLPPGRYAINWDGKDDRRLTRASGIYFYRLSLGGKVITHQLLLLK